jgi:hypothetical protein
MRGSGGLGVLERMSVYDLGMPNLASVCLFHVSCWSYGWGVFVLSVLFPKASDDFCPVCYMSTICIDSGVGFNETGNTDISSRGY